MTPELFDFYLKQNNLIFASKGDLLEELYKALDIIAKIGELCSKAGIDLNTVQKLVELKENCEGEKDDKNKR